MRLWKKRRSSGSDLQDVLFDVTGMSCGSCVARIEQVLSDQVGVEDAEVDLDSARARVTANVAVSVDSLIAAVAEAGYTMTSRA